MRTFGARHLVLVFVVGLVAGLALGLHYSRWNFTRPGPGARSEAKFVEKFGRDLDLTADQKKKLEAILAKKQRELKSVRDAVDPKLGRIRRETTAEIERILTPEQVKLFRKHQRRFDRKRGPRGPGAAAVKP